MHTWICDLINSLIDLTTKRSCSSTHMEQFYLSTAKEYNGGGREIRTLAPRKRPATLAMWSLQPTWVLLQNLTVTERVGFEPTVGVNLRRFSRPFRYSLFGTSPKKGRMLTVRLITTVYRSRTDLRPVSVLGEIRTLDHLIKSQVLCLLSYKHVLENGRIRTYEKEGPL